MNRSSPLNHVGLLFQAARSGQRKVGAGQPPILLFLLLSMLLFASGCRPTSFPESELSVQVQADGQKRDIRLPAAATVEQALEAAQISLGDLDRVDPPAFTTLADGDLVQVVRVREEITVEQVPIPFEQQTLRNESLPVEEELLIQKGMNGLQEITYRYLFEDGVLATGKPVQVKAEVIEEPVPEIRMIGIQAPVAPVNLAGTLFYIRDGNLWMMRGDSTNRNLLVTSGDLDGRILSISGDGKWLLFTRSTASPGQINTLWAAALPDSSSTNPGFLQQNILPVSLGIENVIHFADFVPGSVNKVVFSTVEPREAAPGWQANNDLNVVTYSDNGWTTQWTRILESNAGGVYGWWGTSFAWSPDGRYLAYSRADSAGLVEYQTGVMTSTLNILPYQTRQDWAWVPGLTWGPDGKTLFTLDHIAEPGASNPEASQFFDLTALLLDSQESLHLVSQTGMFAYPLASPLQQNAEGADYQIAYLQAIFPGQSETSRYRVTVMDRDGSNRRTLFPAEEKPGMEPEQVWGAWSPYPLPSGSAGSTGSDYGLAVIHEGNIWLVNSRTGEAIQVTGDGLAARILWH